MGSGVFEPWDVPAAWRDAAEEVRSHLCALRGGALFLSSSDALLLVGWLEQDVPVGAILQALERAAESRRKRRSRFPLRLQHAKVHLGRPARGVFGCAGVVPDAHGPLFAPVLRALRTVPDRQRTSALDGLERALAEIDDTGESAVREALAAVRSYLEAAWEALGDEGRAALRAEARAALGDLVHLVDEKTTTSLVEEGARDLLRARTPCLSAASLWEVVRNGQADPA